MIRYFLCIWSLMGTTSAFAQEGHCSLDSARTLQVFVSVDDKATEAGVVGDSLRIAAELMLRQNRIVIWQPDLEAERTTKVVSPPPEATTGTNERERARSTLDVLFDRDSTVWVSVQGLEQQGGLIYVLRVEFMQSVLLPRDLRWIEPQVVDVAAAGSSPVMIFGKPRTGVTLHKASTWRTGSFGYAPMSSLNARIKAALGEALDEFVNEYLAANPR